jgi:hypothetical protein
MGFEPTACSLRMSCSTAELKRQNWFAKIEKILIQNFLCLPFAKIFRIC